MGGSGNSRGCLVIPIIVVMLAIAWFASNALGDPSALPGEAQPFALDIQLPVFSGQLDNGEAEARAQSARSTADAIQSNKIRATDSARSATEDARVNQTQEANRIAFEATERAQETTSAYFMKIAEWTKEADSVRSTSESQITATQAVIQATEQARAADLEYAKQSAKATATASAMQDEQEKRALDLRQKQLTNDFWAVAKFVIPIAALVLLGFVGYLFVKQRTDYTVIQPAANGDKPTILHRGSIIDPDLLTQPINQIGAPTQIPLENQLQVKANDQQVNMARAMPRLIPQAIATPGPGFEVINENSSPPAHLLPDPGGMGAIDGDWNAE